MRTQSTQVIESEINILEALFVIAILITAYYFQFAYKEIPCPLCLLQRIGFLGIAFGLLLNVRVGIKPIHYGIAIISGLYTQFVSGRQILLHITPGSGHYGTAIFGIHLYTWSFIAASALILSCVALLIFHNKLTRIKMKHCRLNSAVSTTLLLLMTLIAFSNIITTYLECGISQCPDNPTKYKNAAKEKAKKAQLTSIQATGEVDNLARTDFSST